ncbi:uncharacterized protein LOC131660737 isoform X2 [Vicia villosa]|uniref:uncharacterized protein LOC131660737 isoform X2 n=1 Tax=Vicia villosa TaxID=3911 RepID=UPI00273BAE7D|nr:uncharacterized protein LOC131660737 isoform X2 [Vicia villosa]
MKETYNLAYKYFYIFEDKAKPGLLTIVSVWFIRKQQRKNVKMSFPILKGFVPLNTDQLYGMLANIKEEPRDVTEHAPAEVLFPEINVLLKEVKKEREAGEPSNANNSVGGLPKEFSWLKEISKSGKRGNQHFRAEAVHKVLRPDITSSLIRDFDTGEHLPCKIIKSNKSNMEMYLGKG